MTVPVLAALTSFLLELFGSGHYIRDTRRGKTRPHLYSWGLWTLLAAWGTAVQLVEGSWTGAFFLGTGAILNGTVFFFGVRQKGERRATKTDRIALGLSLLTIPLWLAARDPLSVAVFISAINLFASYPSYRKAWDRPEEENLKSFIVYAAVTTIGLFSIDPLTLASAFYPVAIALLNAGLVPVIFFRRRALSLRPAL